MMKPRNKSMGFFYAIVCMLFAFATVACTALNSIPISGMEYNAPPGANPCHEPGHPCHHPPSTETDQQLEDYQPIDPVPKPPPVPSPPPLAEHH
ncbi:unnamed protein product [Linum trigynum]|uniref:Uncharacterized protein n=1 Tax=Linum trigynum TaxID=586398 RepID=A0AAV2CWV7_9ROSI